jgi:hypothetical protein
MEDAAAAGQESRVAAAKGGKGKGVVDWRVWPGGPPGAGVGGLPLGGGADEVWGFYDRAEQVDSLIASLNPQVTSATPLHPLPLSL